MNPLLGIAKVAIRHKRNNVFKWCASKRHRQYQVKWAKEKAAIPVAADSNDFDEIGW